MNDVGAQFIAPDDGDSSGKGAMNRAPTFGCYGKMGICPDNS